MKKSVMVMVAALGLMAMVSGCSGQAAGKADGEEIWYLQIYGT